MHIFFATLSSGSLHILRLTSHYVISSVTLREYSASTTIHGISYLFDRENHALDRVFWAVVVVVAIYGATKLSAVAYIGWQDDPVITIIGTTGLPIEKVKFPSITICGQGTAKEIVDAALFKQFKLIKTTSKK